MISIVAAYANNRVIGKGNDLPWHLPADLKHFKNVTSGGTVIMGRNTYESIYKRLKGPLPDRRNIVVSRRLDPINEAFVRAPSLDAALDLADAFNPDDEVFVIGGEQLFRSVIEQDLVDQMYLTEIDADIDGDTYLPMVDDADWLEVSRTKYTKDDKNPYDYSFILKIRMVK